MIVLPMLLILMYALTVKGNNVTTIQFYVGKLRKIFQ